MKKKIIPVLALAVVAAMAAWYFFFHLRANGADRLDLTGHIETVEVDLSFRLAGHVALLPVDEGSQVKKDDLLAELDRSMYQARLDQAAAKVAEIQAYLASLEKTIQLKSALTTRGVEQARAGVQAAEARYKALTTGSRAEEIRAAEAALELAKAEHDKRQADYERMKRLFDQKIISRSEFESVQVAFDAARAGLIKAREQHSLVKTGPRLEAVEEGRAALSGYNAALGGARASLMEVEKLNLDLKVVEAQQAQAQAALTLAETDLAQTRIYAPFGGFVTVRAVEPGEYVQPGAVILSLAELDKVWVSAYVPETRLGFIKLGQKAEVKTDSFPDKVYPGQVTFISSEAEFTPKNVQTREERIKLVYRIKISLENPDQELKPGMPADIVIR